MRGVSLVMIFVFKHKMLFLENKANQKQDNSMMTRILNINRWTTLSKKKMNYIVCNSFS
jgi:hypothetical protein